MNDISIKFLKWEKWQARHDIKSPSWFKFSNTFFIGPELFDLDLIEKAIFVFILCEASRSRKNGKLEISSDWIVATLRIEKRSVLSCLEKLSKIKLIEYIRTDHVRDANVDVRNPCSRLDEIRLEENRIEEIRKRKKLLPTPTKTKTALAPTSFLWETYFSEYTARWKKDPPPRNAQINAQLKTLISRFGLESCHEIIRHYFRMPETYYLKNFHPIGLLVKDGHKIFSAMSTGITITKGLERNIDNQQTFRETMSAIDRGEV